jgi:hypothetical protein
MALEVHYYDRRNGERKIVTQDLDWQGPYWWAEGNGSCDCNRSHSMYPGDRSKELRCSKQINLIQIEKIVSGGQVVYQEKGTQLPPRLVALLVANNTLAQLLVMGVEGSKPGELAAAVERLKESRQALANCADTAALVAICDLAIESAGKIAAYEADDTVELDLMVEWGALADCSSNFAMEA